MHALFKLGDPCSERVTSLSEVCAQDRMVRSLPPHLETKNLQILVATDMIAGNAGPPQGLQVSQG
jgi:hypothetical protein